MSVSTPEVESYLPQSPDELLSRQLIKIAWDSFSGPFADIRDEDDDPAFRDALVKRFEAAWGPFTMATLAHIAREWAPPQTAEQTLTLESLEREWEDGFLTDPQNHAGASIDATAKDTPRVVDPFKDTDEDWDRLFVLEVLGHSAHALARETLPLYLTSPQPRERWTSALWLGRLHEWRALPYLVQMLTEFLPPIEVYDVHERRENWYADWRRFIPSILAQATDRQLIPHLRHALLVMLAVEQRIPRPDGPEVFQVERRPSPRAQRRPWSEDATIWGSEEEATINESIASKADEAWRLFGVWERYREACRPWIMYQHRLVYNLGKLGAFGALLDISLPSGGYQESASTVWHKSADGATERIGKMKTAGLDHPDQFRALMWRVEAICGFLESDYNTQFGMQTYYFRQVPTFRQAVEQHLMSQFGLSGSERQRALQDYEGSGYLWETARHYVAVAGQTSKRGYDSYPVGWMYADDYS